MVGIAQCCAWVPISNVCHRSKTMLSTPVLFDVMCELPGAKLCHVNFLHVDASPVLWRDMVSHKLLCMLSVVIDNHVCMPIPPQQCEHQPCSSADTEFQTAHEPGASRGLHGCYLQLWLGTECWWADLAGVLGFSSVKGPLPQPLTLSGTVGCHCFSIGQPLAAAQPQHFCVHADTAVWHLKVSNHGP